MGSRLQTKVLKLSKYLSVILGWKLDTPSQTRGAILSPLYLFVIIIACSDTQKLENDRVSLQNNP